MRNYYHNYGSGAMEAWLIEEIQSCYFRNPFSEQRECSPQKRCLLTEQLKNDLSKNIRASYLNN